MSRLKGSWKRTTEDKQALKYPRFLEFRDWGLYSASQDENGLNPLWDAGTWEIVSPSKVKISTNNDAEILYQFYVRGDKLVFTDNDKIRITYQRTDD